jgi:hypothetical protein
MIIIILIKTSPTTFGRRKMNNHEKSDSKIMCQVLDIRATLPFLTGMKLSLPTTDRYLYKIFY